MDAFEILAAANFLVSGACMFAVAVEVVTRRSPKEIFWSSFWAVINLGFGVLNLCQ